MKEVQKKILIAINDYFSNYLYYCVISLLNECAGTNGYE